MENAMFGLKEASQAIRTVVEKKRKRNTKKVASFYARLEKQAAGEGAAADKPAAPKAEQPVLGESKTLQPKSNDVADDLSARAARYAPQQAQQPGYVAYKDQNGNIVLAPSGAQVSPIPIRPIEGPISVQPGGPVQPIQFSQDGRIIYALQPMPQIGPWAPYMAPHAQQAPPYGVPPGYIQAPPYGVPPGYPPLQYPPYPYPYPYSYPYPPVAPPEPKQTLPKTPQERNQMLEKTKRQAETNLRREQRMQESDNLWAQYGDVIGEIFGSPGVDRPELVGRMVASAGNMKRNGRDVMRFVAAMADPNDPKRYLSAEDVDFGLKAGEFLHSIEQNVSDCREILKRLGTRIPQEEREKLKKQLQQKKADITARILAFNEQNPAALKRIVEIADTYKVQPTIANIGRLGSLKRLQQMDKDYKDAVRQVASARKYMGIKLYPLPHTPRFLVDENGYMYTDESGTISPAKYPSGEHIRRPDFTPYHRSFGRLGNPPKKPEPLVRPPYVPSPLVLP